MQSVKGNFKWYLLLILLLANILIYYAVFTETRNGILTVTFLDVGQGDAALIDVPQYRTLFCFG